MNSQQTQMNAFITITAITYILYFGTFLGLLSSSTSKYIATIHSYMEIYISLFLVYRFNPLTHNKLFTKLDKQIAFAAGTFLLMSTTIGLYLKQYLNIPIN